MPKKPNPFAKKTAPPVDAGMAQQAKAPPFPLKKKKKAAAKKKAPPPKGTSGVVAPAGLRGGLKGTY